MIRQLPSSSRLVEAMANDDELASSLAEPEGDGSGPRLSEYTADVARLDIVSDLLKELISVVVSVAGGKPPRVKPARRPETAFDRQAKRRREQRIGSLIAEVEAAQQRWSPPDN
jgi:hypothetical protein